MRKTTEMQCLTGRKTCIFIRCVIVLSCVYILADPIDRYFQEGVLGLVGYKSYLYSAQDLFLRCAPLSDCRILHGIPCWDGSWQILQRQDFCCSRSIVLLRVWCSGPMFWIYHASCLLSSLSFCLSSTKRSAGRRGGMFICHSSSCWFWAKSCVSYMPFGTFFRSVDWAYGYHPFPPYACCTGNPIRFVDPNGEKVPLPNNKRCGSCLPSVWRWKNICPNIFGAKHDATTVEGTRSMLSGFWAGKK